ncbi:MAG: GNAT family N-acetyltransferase [Actinobacteria bacterium]|nr:GNAT family N-acetyltransferase [Actinomycetota bacterium]
MRRSKPVACGSSSGSPGTGICSGGCLVRLTIFAAGPGRSSVLRRTGRAGGSRSSPRSTGGPVGGVVAFVPRWHAQRVWVSVEVAAGHRRQGIGTALLEAVRERCRSDGRPLRGKVFAGSAAAAFATAQGFKLIQRSRIFRLDKGDVDGPGHLVIDRPAAPAAALVDAVPRPVLVEADDSAPTMLAALAAREATVIEEVHLVAEA